MPKLQIVPSILCKTRKELVERIKKVEPYVKKVQVDIMDGEFVPNKTIQAEHLKSIKTRLKLEAHMMVENPGKYVNKFAALKTDTFIFHIESCKSKRKILKLISRIKEKKMKPSIALNPETPLTRVKPYLKNVNHVLIMTVYPGFGGQKFIRNMLRKIRMLRRLRKDIDIEVDGGVNPETAKLARKAGANLLVAGMSIFGSNDVKKAVRELKVL